MRSAQKGTLILDVHLSDGRGLTEPASAEADSRRLSFNWRFYLLALRLKGRHDARGESPLGTRYHRHLWRFG